MFGIVAKLCPNPVSRHLLKSDDHARLLRLFDHVHIIIAACCLPSSRNLLRIDVGIFQFCRGGKTLPLHPRLYLLLEALHDPINCLRRELLAVLMQMRYSASLAATFS